MGPTKLTAIKDDAWGAFTSVNTSDSSNPFSDDAFTPSASSSTDAYRAASAEPLTPRDWAEAFDREFDTAPKTWDDESEQPEQETPRPTPENPLVLPTPDEDDSASAWSFPADPSSASAASDLPPATTSTADVLATALPTTPADIKEMSDKTSALSMAQDAAQHPAPSALETPEQHLQHERAQLHAHFAANQPAPEQTGASQEADLDRLAGASTAAEPLGPGVSADTHVGKDGLLYRRMPDGSVVSAPEDDVAMGIEDAREGKLGKKEQDKVDSNFK